MFELHGGAKSSRRYSLLAEPVLDMAKRELTITVYYQLEQETRPGVFEAIGDPEFHHIASITNNDRIDKITGKMVEDAGDSTLPAVDYLLSLCLDELEGSLETVGDVITGMLEKALDSDKFFDLGKEEAEDL